MFSTLFKPRRTRTGALTTGLRPVFTGLSPVFSSLRLVAAALLLVATPLRADNGDVVATPDTVTGGLRQLTIEGDPNAMHWLVATDRSQYEWIGPEWQWGLGFVTVEQGDSSRSLRWTQADSIARNGSRVRFDVGPLTVRVERKMKGGDLVERYTLRNTGRETVRLRDIGICLPFNDNYPDAVTCMTQRCNAHIWAGFDAAYVCALRMNGLGPHLGLAVTEGEISDYEIRERGPYKGNSMTRGIIVVNLPDCTLAPGAATTTAWRVFSHAGKDDFERQLLRRGSYYVDCDRYVIEQRDTLCVRFHSAQRLPTLKAAIVEKKLKLSALKREVRRFDVERTADGFVYTLRVADLQPGEATVTFSWGNGRRTQAKALVIENIDTLVARRVAFIRTRQQLNRPGDPRDGAYMVYDNEGDSIFLDIQSTCSPNDRDEGAERVGMGVLLAKYERLHPSPALRASLERYARFVREGLQTPDYVTYSTAAHDSRNRAYNYMWVADLQFRMWELTGQQQHALDGYGTLRAMFRQFGHNFYAIDIPVVLGLDVLQRAGLTAQRDTLLGDFRLQAASYLKNGSNYPKHEVNYEQSIVAPAVQFLSEMYLVTGEKAYLDEARRQLPALDAFGGRQPDYRLHDIAIRHWDGYWFGKRERYGDTFPHYWSTLTGSAFYYYALASGDAAYRRRAEDIVLGNLCLFDNEGHGSCAYLYPRAINGQPARYFDPFANDQDWALVFYLLVMQDCR